MRAGSVKVNLPQQKNIHYLVHRPHHVWYSAKFHLIELAVHVYYAYIMLNYVMAFYLWPKGWAKPLVVNWQITAACTAMQL